MYDANDNMLCTIGKKKAHWYVEKKKLAVWRTPLVEGKNGEKEQTHVNPSIRLLFTPQHNNAGAASGEIVDSNDADANGIMTRPFDSDDHQAECSDKNLRKYNTSHKKNICVA